MVLGDIHFFFMPPYTSSRFLAVIRVSKTFPRAGRMVFSISAR
jgi:hypothetical protein